MPMFRGGLLAYLRDRAGQQGRPSAHPEAGSGKSGCIGPCHQLYLAAEVKRSCSQKRQVARHDHHRGDLHTGQNASCA